MTSNLAVGQPQRRIREGEAERLTPQRARVPWGLVTVGAVGLAVRLLFATVAVPQLERQTHVAADPDRYADLAAGLLDRGELGFSPPGASPTSLRGPAFPAWLAAGMIVGGRSPGWVSFWASLPGLIAALAIAFLLTRSHGPLAGLTGGLLAAAHPMACFVSSRVLPDEFYGAALFCGLAAWWRSQRSDGNPKAMGWGALAGALLSVATLTRVTAALFLIPIVAGTLLARPRRLVASLAAVLVAAGLLGGWTWRTSALVRRPAFIESLAGYNFWLGESAYRYGFSTGYAEGRSRAHELMAEEAGTDQTRSSKFWHGVLAPAEARAFDGTLVSAGMRSIESRPLAYVERCAAGLLWFWIRAESLQRTLQYAVVALPFLALGAVGAVKLRSRGHPDALPLGMVVAAVLVHVVVYAAICPMARYSVQVYPLLSYLAGAACTTGRSTIKAPMTS